MYKRQPINKAPIIDPKVPKIDTDPDEPLSTWIVVNIKYGLFLDRKPISVAQVSAVEADNAPKKPNRKI